MRTSHFLLAALAVVAAVSAERSLLQITPDQNFKPVTITANSAPYEILATPITPNAPYSQAAYQCNVSGDSRYPLGGTFPLTVKVPVGQRVRVIFANGNLDGSTVTQQGEPGVIVQQGGAVIVQQVGGASPIVQPVGSPVVQQSNVPPAALVVQQTATVVQQTYPQAPSVPNPPPVAQPPPTEPTPPTTPDTPTTPDQPTPETPPPDEPTPETPPPDTTEPPTTEPPASDPPTLPTIPPLTPTTAPSTGRKLLQDTVPGGPNNGQVEYVALASANSVTGFVVPNTQFGVPYVEYTASAASAGQTATFRGVLEVAVVIGGVPQFPFRPNPRLSPECQVNVNFQNA